MSFSTVRISDQANGPVRGRIVQSLANVAYSQQEHAVLVDAPPVHRVAGVNVSATMKLEITAQ